MTNKVEWEIVDTPSPGTSQASRQLPHFFKALLGPWWKWKLAGAGVAMGTVLLLFATLAGIFLVGLAVVAAMSIGIAGLKGWLRRDHQAKADSPIAHRKTHW